MWNIKKKLQLIVAFIIFKLMTLFFPSSQNSKPELSVLETEKSDYDFNIEERTQSIE